MKNVLLSLLFCLVISTGYVSTCAESESRFQRVEIQEEKIEVGGLLIPSTYTYHLTENEVIAFVFDTSSG